MQIIVDGLLTHYQEGGKGKLVLLLHGWGDDSRTFELLRRRLIKDYQVLSLDLPGFGASQAPNMAWDLDNYAEFLKGFLAKLSKTPLYAVIGHSNGGALAIRAIATHKLKSEKLILLAASGIRSPQSFKRNMLQTATKVGKILVVWLPKRQQEKLRRRLYKTIGSDLLVVEGMQDTFKKTVRQDVQADAAQLKLPVLLIYAPRDQAVPFAHGQRYQQLIAGARLEPVEPAGHFVHLDQPDKTARLIEGFLTC